jgi:thymidine kinase
MANRTVDLLGKMLEENADVFKTALATDFKTASFEPQQEIMVCLGSIAETREKLREWIRRPRAK